MAFWNLDRRRHSETARRNRKYQNRNGQIAPNCGITLIGLLTKEQRTKKKNIALLAKKSAEMETTLSVTRQADHLIMRNIRREVDLDQVITSAVHIAGAAAMAFRQEVRKISLALSHTQQGRVSSIILPPRKLKQVLSDIREHLPQGWAPAISRLDTPAEIYNILDIAAIAIPSGWKVHVKIPLMSRSYGNFQLYQVSAIPTHFPNSSAALKTETPAEYFAISDDQRLHITAKAEENARYRQIPQRVICDEISPLIQESREGCLYHAFRDNRAEAERACVRKVTRSSPQVYPVSETKWLYALPKEKLFAMQCSGKLKPTEGFRLQLGTGVFTLPSGCSAIGDRYIIPAHLKGNLERSSRWSADDLTHFKINLNMSSLFSRMPNMKKLDQTMLENIIKTLPKPGDGEPTLTEMQDRMEEWSDPSEQPV